MEKLIFWILFPVPVFPPAVSEKADRWNLEKVHCGKTFWIGAAFLFWNPRFPQNVSAVREVIMEE